MVGLRLVAPVAGAALAFSLVQAMAATTKYDGTWQIEAPRGEAYANITNPLGCDPVNVQIQVKDGKVSGKIKMAAFGYSKVENASDGSPVTGEVEPDGRIIAHWQNVDVLGQMTGDTGEVHWRAECGPRIANLTRVSQ